MLDSPTGDRYPAVDMSPQDFERWTADFLRRADAELSNFKVANSEVIQSADGAYSFDATVRFESMGLSFLVLVECKHQKRPIERQQVQVLQDKLRSVSAQKAVLFATTGFQRGAIEYAKLNRIALVRVVEGKATVETRALLHRPVEPPPWVDVPEFCAFVVRGTDRGVQFTSIDVDHNPIAASWDTDVKPLPKKR